MALTSPLETRRDARVLRAGSVSLARVFTLLSDEMAAAAEEAVVVVDIGGRTTKKKTDDDDDDDVEGAADGEAEDLLELCEEDVWGTMYGDEEERDDLDAERASVSSDDEDEDDDEGCAARASPERASIRFPPPLSAPSTPSAKTRGLVRTIPGDAVGDRLYLPVRRAAARLPLPRSLLPPRVVVPTTRGTAVRTLRIFF